jgi:murein DD-endopeptidase MepM/ murein hydrolase activator NlpD
MRIAVLAGLLALLLPPTTSPTPPRLLAPGPSWQSPIPGAPVVRPFDPPAQPWLPGHRGVDLGARESTVVHAAGSGEVIFAGFLASRPLISIAHPNGTRTTYEPVDPLVAVGQAVATGDPIGRLLPGHNGALHWGLKRGDTYLDPLALITRTRVRLLPTTHRRRPLHRPFRLLRPAPH